MHSWRTGAGQGPGELSACASDAGCLTSEVAVAAVLGGSVAACETLLIREGCDSTAVAVGLEAVAAEAGQLEVLQWLLQARREQLLQRFAGFHMFGTDRAPEELAIAAAACRGGHAHVLAWLQEQEQQQQQHQQEQQQLPGLGAIFGAPAAGPLTISHPKAVPFLAAAAAAGGHLTLLAQLLPRLEPIPTGAAVRLLEKVAHGCPLEVLQRIFHHLYAGDAEPNAGVKQTLAFAAVTSPTADWAAKLDWVLQQPPNGPMPGHPNPPVSLFTDQDVLCDAAGALPDWAHRLQALQARRVPLPRLPPLMTRAAEVGDVAALRWLLEAQQREGGEAAVSAELMKKLTEKAAAAGHVAMLAELSERGGDVGIPHVLQAAEQGKVDAVRWLLEAQQLQPSEGDLQLIFAYLAGKGTDQATLRQLHEQHGAPIEDLSAFMQAASLEAVEWVVAMQRARAAALHGGQVPRRHRLELLWNLHRRGAWADGALFGNLAAADWAAQQMAHYRFVPPLAPCAGSEKFNMAPREEDTFAALRWWLRQRQEGCGLTQVVGEEVEGVAPRGERVGALTDAEWRAVLKHVAASVFPAPASPNQWNYSRAQWNWLVSKRLEVAAAQAEAAGATREQVEGAVAAARAEAEELAATATRVNRFEPLGLGPFDGALGMLGQGAMAAQFPGGLVDVFAALDQQALGLAGLNPMAAGGAAPPAGGQDGAGGQGQQQ
ncbi:hypothetical protein HXX76_001695 [Chlamydomonas incerta]|uniref:Uncharacterized protein n=1 Tax=Chlamydomonas incerta TaxID=51695 RepID=A0A835WCK4_CHLIN|nr:hypothetical protein HXX76_001695 [Chlamydomonas incerta]|eukprot:KAG2444959.1 hypothetical protein HXX76_001695 [Chlamydomonas incerta]